MEQEKPKTWERMVATVLGAGYSPVAPGTAGTLAGVPIFLGLAQLSAVWYLLVWLGLFLLACRVAQRMQEAEGVDDPQMVVIDEVAGFLLAMFMVPLTAGYLLAGFVIFRALDVIKPFPADYFDQEVRNGFGIVMDDVVSGFYTCLLLHLFQAFFG